MANQITKYSGNLVVADIATNDLLVGDRLRVTKFWTNWFKINKIQAFYNLTFAKNLSDGCKIMTQVWNRSLAICVHLSLQWRSAGV